MSSVSESLPAPTDFLRVRQEVAAAALRSPSGLDVHLPSSAAGQRRKQGLAQHREGPTPTATASFSERYWGGGHTAVGPCKPWLSHTPCSILGLGSVARGPGNYFWGTSGVECKKLTMVPLLSNGEPQNPGVPGTAEGTPWRAVRGRLGSGGRGDGPRRLGRRLRFVRSLGVGGTSSAARALGGRRSCGLADGLPQAAPAPGQLQTPSSRSRLIKPQAPAAGGGAQEWGSRQRRGGGDSPAR